MMMRKIYWFIGLLLISAGTYAQTPADTTKSVFTFVEEMPAFPGGEAALYKFIGSNVRYPDSCVKKGIEGKVYVKFVVNEDGSISNITVARSAGDPLLDAEAVRVVSIMPAWKPGRSNGSAVKVYFMLPILFRMEEDKPAKK